MSYTGISGVSWHIEYLRKAESDERRDKRACLFYGNGICHKRNEKCYGSAHCKYYFGKKKEIKDFITVGDVVTKLAKFIQIIANKPGINLSFQKICVRLQQAGLDDIAYYLSPMLLEKACDYCNLPNNMEREYKFSVILNKDGIYTLQTVRNS